MMSRALIAVYLAFLIYSCKTSLRVSKYSRYNEFSYNAEQPNFSFKNEKLNIAGKWWWAGGQRAIPKVRYLPDSIKRLLSGYVKKDGPVLFSTFDPNSRRFPTGKSVAVSKADVRRQHHLVPPFYETVLISEKRFDRSNPNYIAVNSNESFSIFAKKKIGRFSDYLLLDLIAAEETRYYTFICIINKQFIRTEEDSTYQMNSFINDVHQYFRKK